MQLPPLTIPQLPLPFEIPGMIHPLFVHFAIALPLLVLLIELVNLFAKKRTLGVLSFFLMLLITGVFVAAYLTGVTDGKAAKAFLSPEAKEMLAAHKQLGIYLVYASGILLLFKLFSVLIRKTPIKILFFLVLVLFVAAVFNEGKKGGVLVYQYGVNVKSVPAISNAPKTEKAAKAIETKEANSTLPDTVVPETVPGKETVPSQEKADPASPEAEQPKAETSAEVSNTEGNVSH